MADFLRAFFFCVCLGAAGTVGYLFGVNADEQGPAIQTEPQEKTKAFLV